MQTFAIIQTGGKQYKVWKGLKLEIEKIKTTKTNDLIELTPLLVKEGNEIFIGKPTLNNFKVIAKNLGEKKGKKIIIFKMKPKKRYKVKKGHRQIYNLIEILEIKKIDNDFPVTS